MGETSPFCGLSLFSFKHSETHTEARNLGSKAFMLFVDEKPVEVSTNEARGEQELMVS